jgi:hypothetical protein
MTGSAHRVRRPLQRLGWLLLGRNALRRPVDRIEAAVIICLVAAFLTVAVAAACFAGHICQSQRAAAARLRPAAAVLSQPGPVATSPVPAARARWPLPNGTEHSGTLTTVTAPAIGNAPAGTSVQLRLDRSGKPLVPPPSLGDTIFTALLVGIIPTAGATVVLILSYRLCRMVLDRHRLARWESAWEATGPRWTSRR